MAVKNCWQQKKLEEKEYFDRYRESIAVHKQSKEPGFNNWELIKKMTQYRVTLSRNWFKIIPCIISEIMSHFPYWFMALFRFCPKCKQQCADESFLIVGHRGAAAYEVENTIPSFHSALHNHGANALELDICLTKDGQVVVWHDWEPDGKVAKARQIGLEPDVMCKPFILNDNEKKPVHELTLAELRENYGYTKKKGRSKKLDAYIPTLREVLAWSQGQPKLRGLFIDVKTPLHMKNLVPRMMKEITAIMHEFKPGFPVVFLSPKIEIIKAMKHVNGQLNYSFDLALPLGIVIDPDEYSCVQKAIELNNNYASIGRPPILNLGPWTTYRMVIEYDTQLKDKYNLVSKSPIEGLFAWTINRGSEMKCLIRMGVNGILTDKPDLLSAQVQKVKVGSVISRFFFRVNFRSFLPGSRQEAR